MLQLVFQWRYDVPISDGNMVLKVSPQSVKSQLPMENSGRAGTETFDIADGATSSA
jgi:hypothetical protein